MHTILVIPFRMRDAPAKQLLPPGAAVPFSLSVSFIPFSTFDLIDNGTGHSKGCGDNGQRKGHNDRRHGGCREWREVEIVIPGARARVGPGPGPGRHEREKYGENNGQDVLPCSGRLPGQSLAHGIALFDAHQYRLWRLGYFVSNTVTWAKCGVSIVARSSLPGS